MNKLKVFSALLGSVLLVTAQSTQAKVILDVGPGLGIVTPCESGSGSNCSGGETFGWGFNVTSTIKIDGIGLWDAGADGIGPSVQTGLWDSFGTLLTSATISNASSPEASNGINGEWLFETVPILTLTPGRYNIGSVFFPFTPLSQQQILFSITTIPEITYLNGLRAGASNIGLTNPTMNFGFGLDGVFGPNLRLAQISEPSTLVLFGFGLASFGLARRRRVLPS